MTSPAACRFHALAVSQIDNPGTAGIRPLVGPALHQELSANPDTTPDTPCLFCLTDESGRAVSWIRAWADRFHVDGSSVPWLWTGDLHTVPDLRGRGLATHLQQESTRWAEQRGFGRGSVFSTDETLSIYRKLGYLLPGFAGRQVLLRSARPVLAGHITSRRVVAAASAGLRPLAALAGAVIAARCRRWAAGTAAERSPDTSGARAAAVIAAAEQTMPVRFNISADKLQWKMDNASKKGGPCTLTLVFGERGPLAMAVTRTRVETRPLAGRYRDFRCTTALDFVLADRTEPAARALVGHLVGAFVESADAEVFQLVSYDPLVAQAARRLGLMRAGRGMSFACRLPPGLRPPDDAGSIASWPVTHFSGDGPFF